MPQHIPDSIDRQIGHRLRTIRRSRGISAAQIARQVGVSTIQVGSYERGTSSMSVATLYRISVILDAPVMAFYEGKGEGGAAKNYRSSMALDRVADVEVRECLRLLIATLGRQIPPQG